MEPGGQIDFQQILAAAAQMQSHLMSAQEQLAEAEIDGTAGGGLVKVTVDGQGELIDLVIAAEVIDPGDPQETAQTVADLILAACRDAYRELADVQSTMMGPLAGGLSGLSGLGGDLGGSGIPGLPGGIPGLPGFPGLPGQLQSSPDPDDPGHAGEPGHPDDPGHPGHPGDSAGHGEH